MKPYYESKGITIYHGDCREILPVISGADLILTDPPYGINENHKKVASRGKLATPRDYGSFDWDKEPIEYDLIEMCISRGHRAIVFGGNYYPMKPSSCWLVWDKENGTNDFADCELAWTNIKGAVRIFRYKWNGMIQKHMGKHKEVRQHPTQKPQALMEWCIKMAADTRSILDPFMGSGTTLRAAKDLGIKAVGIDINERYCEIAAKRLAQEVLF